jgi:hypothetical protein
VNSSAAVEVIKLRAEAFLAGRSDHLISAAFGQGEGVAFAADLFVGAALFVGEGGDEFLVAAFRGAGGIGGEEVEVIDDVGVEAREVGFDDDG